MLHYVLMFCFHVTCVAAVHMRRALARAATLGWQARRLPRGSKGSRACQGGSREGHEREGNRACPGGSLAGHEGYAHLLSRGQSCKPRMQMQLREGNRACPGGILQAMKATHSFCQGGSRASHQGKCSYTRMQPRLPRGQSCIGHESAPP